MALLYPWATKEYILYKMSVGQLIMYYNLGIETKFGKSEETLEQEKNEKIEKARKEMIDNGLIESDEKVKEDLGKKFGDISS
jgi:hypothetical protein